MAILLASSAITFAQNVTPPQDASAPAPTPATSAFPAPQRLMRPGLPLPTGAPARAPVTAAQAPTALAAPAIPGPTLPAPTVLPAPAPSTLPAPVAQPATAFGQPAAGTPPNPAPGIALPIGPAGTPGGFPQARGIGALAPVGPGGIRVGAAAAGAPPANITKADPALVQATPLLNGIADVDSPTPVMITDMPASQVVRLLELYTGKIILQSQALPATRLTFYSNHDIPLGEAVFSLVNLLGMNGVTIVPLTGNIFRAVPSQDMTTQTPTLLTPGDQMQQLPPNENVYSRFFHLDYMTSDDAARLLTPFMSPRISALISFERSNSIFVTDTLLNLQRVDDILKHADVEAQIQEVTVPIQLHNAKSSDVVTHLTHLQTGPLRKYISTDTSFEADDRTNTIIVITPKATVDLINKLVAGLDADVDPTTKAQVFKIKQAVSGTLVQMLQQVVTGVQNANSARPAAGAAAGRPAAPGGPGGGGNPGATGTAAALAAANSATRDDQFSPYVTIVSDDRSNSIIIYGTTSDIRQLGDLIDKIDIPLPQVRIEAVITEVTLTKGQVSGLSSFGISYHFLPGNTTTGTAGDVGGDRNVLVNTSTNTLSGAAGPAFSFDGSLTNFGLDAVFNVATTNDKVKVLSAPSITTTHNSQATILVTENYPIITSTTTQVQNAATVGNNITQTVTYDPIGITLTVTPLIGDNGIIQMNITQNDETILSFIPINGISQPIIGQREATSFVSVRDGEVIVLGGLQQTNHNVEHDKVFFLGDLPLIGQLFQPVSYNDTTSELIIFIKPTIIKSASVADTMAKETVSSSMASKSVAAYLKTGVVLPPPEETDSPPPPQQTTQTAVLHK
jgi:general secretion pathway protein D